MGRRKIEIVRLPTEFERKMKYSKRRECVLRKASQLSVLCDIDVVLIMFSCSGKLDYFSSQPCMGKILERFIQNIPNMSENAWGKLTGRQDYQEIERDEIKLKLHELQKKMLYPGLKAFNSRQEFQELIQGLQNIRQMVAERREIESQQHFRNYSYNPLESTQNVQNQMLMQQPQMWEPVQGEEYRQQMEAPILGMDDPYAYLNVPWSVLLQQLQEEPETGMLDQLRREHMPQNGVEVLGMKNPSFVPSMMPQNIPMGMGQQLEAPGAAGMWDPLQGGEHMQQLGVEEFRRNPSFIFGPALQ